jgi:hypothetical protein
MKFLLVLMIVTTMVGCKSGGGGSAFSGADVVALSGGSGGAEIGGGDDGDSMPHPHAPSRLLSGFLALAWPDCTRPVRGTRADSSWLIDTYEVADELPACGG